MTRAAYIPAGVHSHGPLPLIPLTLVLLPQFSVLFLVFLCCVWSTQTANAGTPLAVASLWAVSPHMIIDNYKNLTALSLQGKTLPNLTGKVQFRALHSQESKSS